MTSHTLRRRPEGRLQCLACRAAFLTEGSARQAAVPCEGFRLPHGHRYDRQHIVYPTWQQGTDRLCDEPACFCVQHTCDCDVCREVIRVPALSTLLDSREGPTERITPMSASTVSVHLPAQLRKHIERTFVPDDQAGFDLAHSVKALNQGNSQASVTVNLTNDQLGVYLDLARAWSTSSNGNEKRASQSVLSKHELDYVPSDPREIRTEISFPKSLETTMHNAAKYSGKPVVQADIAACSWTAARTTGRVRYETLKWMLEKAEAAGIHNASATQQAGRKFVAKYLPVYEEIGRKVAEFEAEQMPVLAEPSTSVAAVSSGVIVDLAGKIAAAKLRQQGQAAPPTAEPETTVETEQKAEPETKTPWWVRGQIRDLGDARSRKTRLLFGGKAGARSQAPTESSLVTLNYAGEGRYELISLETDEVILTGSLATKVWWAAAPQPTALPEPKAEEKAESSPGWQRDPLRELRGDRASWIGTSFLYGGNGSSPEDAVRVAVSSVGSDRVEVYKVDGLEVDTLPESAEVWWAEPAYEGPESKSGMRREALADFHPEPGVPFVFGGRGAHAEVPVRVTVKEGSYDPMVLVNEAGTGIYAGSPYLKVWVAELADIPAQQEEEAAVEPAAEPAPAGRVWDRMKVANLVNMSSGLSYFYFGGPAKGPVNESGPLVVLDWERSKRGRNPLTDVDTGEEVTVVHSSSYVWAARVEPPATLEQLQPEESAPEQEEQVAEAREEAVPAVEHSAAGTRGLAPANWLELVQEADTESARAWWARKVASWYHGAGAAA